MNVPEAHAGVCGVLSWAAGKRRDPNRVRDRILVRAIERGNANHAQAGLPEPPEITPHSMRRTWATFAASIGRDPKWIAAQIGHTDPQFTFSVLEKGRFDQFVEDLGDTSKDWGDEQ